MSELIKTHQQLRAVIQEELRQGTWSAGSQIPSERQLAKTYDVSRSLVRRAVQDLVRMGLLVSIPGAGTFVTEREPSNQTAHTYAFLVCSRNDPDYTVTTDPFYAQVLRGIELGARLAGNQCLVATVDELSTDFSGLDKIIKIVDGIIIGGLSSKAIHDYLQAAKMPTVLVSPSLKSSVFDTVKIDDVAGARQATEHLLGFGHTRIVFLGGFPDSIPARERFRGYEQALMEKGFRVIPELVSFGKWSFETGRNTIDRLLDTTEFTAVFATADIIAIGAMQTLKERGIRIPEDISIVGFDDLEIASQQAPQLTSVRVEKEYMGELGVNLLLPQIRRPKDFGTTTVVPTRLIQRKSVGEVRRSR